MRCAGTSGSVMSIWGGAMDKLLSVEAIHAGYATARVLHDVTFSLPEKSTLALLGRNGVGKTTLIETIMGLTVQTAGRIAFRGRDISTMQPHHRNAAGMALVPQSVSNLMRPGVEYRALSDATPLVETGLAWRRDNASPVLHGFLELLRKNTLC